MASEHSPSGSGINELTRTRREVLELGLGLFAGAFALAACSSSKEVPAGEDSSSASTAENGAGKPSTPETEKTVPDRIYDTRKGEIVDNLAGLSTDDLPTEDGRFTEVPEYNPDNFPAYSDLDLGYQYQDVPVWNTYQNTATGITRYDRSGCSGSMYAPFSCDVGETETLPAFTLQEMAEEWSKPEDERSLDIDGTNIRHFLLDVIMREKYPDEVAFQGLKRYGNTKYDTVIGLENALPQDATQRATNNWSALGKEFQLAQCVAIDIHNGKIDEEQGSKLLWLLCSAMTGNNKTANKLKDFVTKKAEKIITPEAAQECIAWYTSSIPMPGKSTIGSYENGEYIVSRALQLLIPGQNGGDNLSLIVSTFDGPTCQAFDEGAVKAI